MRARKLYKKPRQPLSAPLNECQHSPRRLLKKMNKIYLKLPTSWLINCLALRPTNTSWLLIQLSPTLFTRKGTSTFQLSLLILLKAKKNSMETSSTFAWGFAMTTESGSVKPKRARPSSRARSRPNYTMVLLVLLRWQLGTFQEISLTKLLTWLFIQNPLSWSTRVSLPSRNTLTLASLNLSPFTTFASRPKRENDQLLHFIPVHH